MIKNETIWKNRGRQTSVSPNPWCISISSSHSLQFKNKAVPWNKWMNVWMHEWKLVTVTSPGLMRCHDSCDFDSAQDARQLTVGSCEVVRGSCHSKAAISPTAQQRADTGKMKYDWCKVSKALASKWTLQLRREHVPVEAQQTFLAHTRTRKQRFPEGTTTKTAATGWHKHLYSFML